MIPSPELRAKILAEVARVPAPTRQEQRAALARRVGLALVAVVALFFLLGGVVSGGRPMSLVVFTAGFALLAGLVATRIASGAPRSMLGRPRSVLLLACIATAPLLAVVPLLADAWWPEQVAAPVPLQAHFLCAFLSLVEGAAPLAILLAVRGAGSDPIHPALSGAALGVAAGAWTTMLAYLRCPHVSATHCIVAHVAPGLVLLVVGALLGRRLLGIREDSI